MSALAAIAMFVELLVKMLPELEGPIRDGFDAFKQAHPELGAAPPPDAEVDVNAGIDQQIAKLAAEEHPAAPDTQPTGTPTPAPTEPAKS